VATNNFLSSVEFKFVINRLPNVEFYVQQVNIPGVNSGYAERMTPFKSIYTPGDTLVYEDLTLQIIADENLLGFKESLSWLEAITRPESFTGYAALNSPQVSSGVALNPEGTGVTSDGTLIILDSNKNANIELTFKEMFPVAVGSIELNTTEADITPPSFTVTFKYSDYSIKVL
jgi:hypothetical protein|tara:strand:- start:4 stop:525 length:522 start_codon:yes stop_codon:yes gene_type:complete